MELCSNIRIALFTSTLTFINVVSPPLVHADNSQKQNPVSVLPASTNNVRVVTFTVGAQTEGLKLFSVKGGTGSVMYELLSTDGRKAGTLPEGLTFGIDGVIRGVIAPTATENQKPTQYAYQVRVRDQGGGVSTVPIRLIINPPLVAEMEPIRMTAGGTINVPIYPYKIRGGTGNVKISYVDAQGALIKAPAGMRFSPDGGISGKVPDSTESLDGVKALIVDQGGGRLLKDLSWVINKPLEMNVLNVLVTAGGRLEEPLQIVKVDGGTGAVRFSFFEANGSTPAALPEGLQLNEVSGTLAGNVPSVVTEKKYVVRAVDQGGGRVELPFIIKINQPLELTTM